MGHFYALLGFGGLLVVLLGASLVLRVRRRLVLPYRADAALLSPSELAFKAVLERAIGSGFTIHARVRAAEVIGLRRRLPRRERLRAYERLGERSFDFLICNAQDSAIRCAVMLAPASRWRRGLPRDRLATICAAAGLPLVRFREQASYSVVEVEERVFAAMSSSDRGASDAVVMARETQRALAELDLAIAEQGPRRRADAPTGVATQVPTQVPTGAAPARSEPVSALRGRQRPTALSIEKTRVPSRAERREPRFQAPDGLEDEPIFHIGGIDVELDDRISRRRGTGQH